MEVFNQERIWGKQNTIKVILSVLMLIIFHMFLDKLSQLGLFLQDVMASLIQVNILENTMLIYQLFLGQQ